MGSAKQPRPFNPDKAALLDEAARETWLPTSVLLQLLDIRERARILDYGTGTARYALRAALDYPAAHVDAYDAQPAMLQIARDRIRESAAVNIAAIGPDPAVLTAAYDRVMAVNVLHEIDDIDLERIHRVLAPDGYVLVVDWNASVPRTFGPPAHHTHTVEDAIARVANAGFSVQAMPDARFPYHFVLRAGTGRA